VHAPVPDVGGGNSGPRLTQRDISSSIDFTVIPPPPLGI
jgi:hypothetical protein